MPEDHVILNTVADGLDAISIRYGIDPESSVTPQELRRIADRIKDREASISSLSKQVRIYKRIVGLLERRVGPR